MFDSILSILKLTQDFTKVTRDQKSYDLTRKENDSEHSFQLALVVWYLANHLNLDLNREKLFKYALVHDLVEVYAGDTAPFTSDSVYNKEISATKKEREELAMYRLREEFKTFDEMYISIADYEKRSDPESKFVYVLDKIIADLNCYLSKERYYVDRNFKYSQWIEWYTTKFKDIVLYSEIEKQLLSEYYTFMTEHKDYYFNE